ncbi:fibronectin type III domain-containing protein [Rubritalea tangerina]|uniref:Fibronectin type III domain-containing protein n=1 Tax=Rubritalea tangerina TaxID=430798 RepID=A0ABW4ZE01_9BACT
MSPRANGYTTYHTLENLLPDTTYYLRAKASSALGTTVGGVVTFKTTQIAQPFNITATDVVTNSAYLRGQIQDEAAGQTVRFEWGLDTSYGSSGNAYASGRIYSTYVSGLLPSTTYHYRMITTGDGITQYSEDFTFTTAPSPTPPELSEHFSVYRITAFGATLWIDTVSAPSNIVFEYGTSESLGQSLGYKAPVTNNLFYKSVTVDLTDLQPDTTYFYRVKATNNQGTTTSSIKSFKTLIPPAIIAKEAEEILGKSATLMGEIDPNKHLLETSFEYGLTEALGSSVDTSTPIVDGENSKDIAVALSDLQPNTTYHYRVAAIDVRGRKHAGPIRTVTTMELIKAWRQLHYGTTENTGDAADLASPYGDGVPNLIKYALGLAPQDRMTPLDPRIKQGDPAKLGITFTRDPLKRDLIYIVEASSTLTEPWEVIATSSHGASTSGSGDISETINPDSNISVEVKDSQAIQNNNKRFMRLRVERSN